MWKNESRTVRVWVICALVIAVVGFAAYVRLAPSDPARWHVQAYPSGLGHFEARAGHVWRGPGDRAMLVELDEVIRAEPRTQRLTGSVEAGMITYVTRSVLWGFPDYTTIGLYQGLIENGDLRYVEINARARFGVSDLAVNKTRVRRWLEALGQG